MKPNSKGYNSFLSSGIKLESQPPARESKRLGLMAIAHPIPHLARTQAEPLLETIGNTPLLRLEKVARDFPDIEIFAKAEYFNPGGSVKDRAALNMVLDGERSGKLNHSRVILDSTSGNTGIAYAIDRKSVV